MEGLNSENFKDVIDAIARLDVWFSRLEGVKRISIQKPGFQWVIDIFHDVFIGRTLTPHHQIGAGNILISGMRLNNKPSKL